MEFYKLAVGARFEFRDKHYQKTAMCMAVDRDRFGNIFRGETEVPVIGESLLLPEAEAEQWKPFQGDWRELMLNRRF